MDGYRVDKCSPERSNRLQTEAKAPQRGMLPGLDPHPFFAPYLKVTSCAVLSPPGSPVLAVCMQSAIPTPLQMQDFVLHKAQSTSSQKIKDRRVRPVFFATYWSFLSGTQLHVETTAK